MTEEEYKKFLETAPKDHFSDEFKLFLINNNKVRAFSDEWLVIENKKYWNEDNDWVTAFCIEQDRDDFHTGLVKLYNLARLFPSMNDRELLIKAPEKRTVKMFHIHLYKKTK